MRVWRRAVGAVTLAAALGLGWLIPYRSILVQGAVPAPGPYTLPVAIPGLHLFVFDTGANRMSSLLVGGRRPWRPVPAMVISHPQKGLIVFDSGLSDAVAQEGEGAMPIPMRWVIISHLDDDHVGRIAAFPTATYVGGRDRAPVPADSV